MEALVPWADFINHSPASGAYVRVSSGVTGELDALTTRAQGLGDSLGGMLGQGGNDDPAVTVRHMHAQLLHYYSAIEAVVPNACTERRVGSTSMHAVHVSAAGLSCMLRASMQRGLAVACGG